MPRSPQSVTQMFSLLMFFKRAFPVAQMVKNTPAMQDTWVQSLGWEDPPEKGMAIHSSILKIVKQWVYTYLSLTMLWKERHG